MAAQELTFRLTATDAGLKAVMNAARSEIQATAQASRVAGQSELSMRQQLAAAQGLQRQRSAAFTQQLTAEHKQAAKAATDRSQSEIKAAAQGAAGMLASQRSTAEGNSLLSKSFASLGDNLNVFASHRIPLVGGAFLRVTENLKGFHVQSGNTEGSVLRLGRAIGDLSNKSGKSVADVQGFLKASSQLGTQAEKDGHAIEFFGAATAQKLIPQLTAASAEMGALTAGSAGAGAGIAALAGPIGIVVIAMAAMVAIGAVLVKQLLDLAIHAAGFRGELFDVSQQLGISVETLSAFEILAKTTGGDLGQISASLGIFQKNLELAQDPTTKQAKLMRELGIETDNTEQALRDTLTRLAAMPEGFHQTATALELFGRGGKSILAIMKEMDGDLDSAIVKFRELGLIVSTEDAKAADELNDQIAILSFQMRALLGKEIMPAALEAFKQLSVLLRENRAAVNAFGQVLGIVSQTVLVAFLMEVEKINKALEILKGAAGLMWQLRAFVRDESVPTGDSFGLEPTAQTQPEGEFVSPGSQVAAASPDAGLQQQSDALKKASEDAKRISAERIANAENALKLGNITRKQETESIIGANKQQLDSEKASLNAELAVQRLRLSKNQNDVDVQANVSKLEQQIRDKDSAFAIDAAKRRVEIQVQERKDLLDHEQKKRDILVGASLAQIAVVEGQIRTGEITAMAGEEAIEIFEQQAFDARRAFLDKQLALAGKEPAEIAKINAYIEALDQEKTVNAQKHADRRTEIIRKEMQNSIDLQLGNIDTILRRGQVIDDRQIATIQALASARKKTEEQAAREILAIKLAAIDREEDAIKARMTAAGAISDPMEKAKQEAALNNELKVLSEQRIAIQQDGDRQIDKGREDDLELERRYAEELISIRRRTNNVERDNAQALIGLMMLRHARRRDIIRAQLKLDIEDENARAKNAADHIAKLRKENEESSRTDEEKADRTYELNLLEEAEAERHRLVMDQIKEQAKIDEAEASPLGGMLDALKSGQLTELAGGIQSWSDVATVAFGAVGAAINQVAQGVGALVSQWVLMGTTGPNAFRKLAATILASIAQQAITLAIMSLAYAALATTAVGALLLGGTPAQFLYAAAMFGAVGVGAAIAGRMVAGNAFQSTTNSQLGGSSSGTSATDKKAPDPKDFDRRNMNTPQGNATLTLELPAGWLGKEMKRDYDLNGFSRLLIKEGK